MPLNPALEYLRKLDEAVALRALARCLHASIAELGSAELGSAKTSPIAGRRQGQAYTLENRALGIEIRLGLPRG